MNPLADWTGAGIGEGVTTANLNARKDPDISAPAVTLWQTGTTLLLWHVASGWYWVSDLACRVFGWSHGGYIRRTL